MEEIRGFMTLFDNCCHGGTRKKATAWWATVDWFLQLGARCDGSHFHEKWNAELINGKVVFPTHLEAAYPILLCERLAAIAKSKPWSWAQFKSKHLQNRHNMHHLHSIGFCLTCCLGDENSSPLCLSLVFTKNGRYRFHMVPQMPFSSKVFQKGPKSYIDSFTRELFGSMQMGNKTS